MPHALARTRKRKKNNVNEIFVLNAIFTFWLIVFPNGAKSAPIENQNELSIPPIKVGTSYDEVRKILMKNGWAPYHGANATLCAPEEEKCKGRPEMQTCSDVDTGRCSWLWKKENAIVTIKTQDDDLFYGASKFYRK